MITLDMTIFKVTSQLLLQYSKVNCYFNTNLNTNLSAEIMSGQIWSGDIKVIVK